ncbi:hypothetical protein IV203_008155 [Nitzschia inconspicua]|uniref:Uncharacterized protein n=1 Tax=Nitzschia inconspicua TaxID=303405 RepID=A0A9K3PLS5_9STRA|nr:hypothetical protein IV203_008155 [Nitzschia inconspicua]
MFGCVSTNDCVPGFGSSLLLNKNNKKRPHHPYPLSPTVTVNFDYLTQPLSLQLELVADKRATTTVSFHHRVSITKCLHVADYTAEERYQTWYSRLELKAMKRQYKKLLSGEAITDVISMTDCKSLIVNPRPPPSPQPKTDRRDDKENANGNKQQQSPTHQSQYKVFIETIDCFRGLEGKTHEGQIKRRLMKENARKVVFEEQQRQASLGFYDPYAISHEYHKATQFSRTSALRLGCRDEEEALEWLCTKDESNDCRSKGGEKTSRLNN